MKFEGCCIFWFYAVFIVFTSGFYGMLAGGAFSWDIHKLVNSFFSFFWSEVLK
jgi:hypothetical protein